MFNNKKQNYSSQKGGFMLSDYNRIQAELMNEFVKAKGGNPEIENEEKQTILMLWFSEGWNKKFRETWVKKEKMCLTN